MSKNDKIKSLYKKVDKKTKFIKMVAEDLGLNPQYVRGHYFSSFWIIPEAKEDRIIELLDRTIENQKATA